MGGTPIVSLARVHAVLPALLQHVVDLASKQHYPDESMHFLAGCLAASIPQLHTYLDHVLLAQPRCVWGLLGYLQFALSSVCKVCSNNAPPAPQRSTSSTPRGVETPLSSVPLLPAKAGGKVVRGQSRLAAPSPPSQQQQHTPAAKTAWGVREQGGSPLLVCMTLGKMLEQRKAYKAALAMQATTHKSGK